MTESAAPQGEDMLTTGQAAAVIGFGTTRKQVIAMLDEGELAYVRRASKKWAKIPLAAALAKRQQLARQLEEQSRAQRAAPGGTEATPPTTE